MADECTTPKCYKAQKSGRCMTPNPWILFMKANKGQKWRDKQHKKTAYQTFKDIYVSRTQNSPVPHAYREALCDQQLHRWIHHDDIHSTLAPPPCIMADDVREFFAQLLPLRIRHSGLSECQVLARTIFQHMLGEPTSRDKKHRYTFRQLLGSGLNGLVFQVKDYITRHEPTNYAVKMVFVHNDPQKLGPRDSYTFHRRVLHSMKEKQFMHEYEIHNHLSTKLKTASSSLLPFRVTRVYFKPVLWSPPIPSKLKVGMYGMAVLPPHTPMLENYLRKRDISRKNQLAMIRHVSLVIEALHNLHLVHGDLHYDNIAFANVGDKRPYLMDFGRSLKVRDDMDAREKASYYFLDYAIFLYTLLHTPPTRDPFAMAEYYNAHVEGFKATYKPRLHSSSSSHLTGRIDGIFTPITRPPPTTIEKVLASANVPHTFHPGQELETRKELLRQLLHQDKLFGNGTKTYCQMVDP